MDLLIRMRAFALVVEEGTFAAAARALGVSRSALTKYVASLERELDVQLLQRSTRQVNVTPAGRAFYEHVRGVLERAEAAVRSVTDSGEGVRGRLRVNAPMTFGALHLGHAIADFMASHPAVEVELVLNDRFVDPIEEGFDVSVRIAAPDHQTSLVLEPLAEARRVLCAAPGYLACAPALDGPDDLQNHRCLFYGYQASGPTWRLDGPGGARAVSVRCTLWSNNGEVLRCAALAGQGVTLLPTFIVGPDLRQGALIPVLPDYRLEPLTLHALHARHRSVDTRVRAFVAHLRAWYAGEPRWERAATPAAAASSGSDPAFPARSAGGRCRLTAGVPFSPDPL